MIPGERYRIQVSLSNSSEQGIIKIKSGSNYSGCAVAGKEMDVGAAFNITFVKYSKIFWLVAVLFPLCTYSLFLMILCNRKFEETVTIAMDLELASMGRYLAPYLCAVIIASLCLFLENIQENKYGKYFVVLLSAILAINMPITDLVTENKDKESNTTEKNTDGHSDIAAILKSVAKRGDRVQFICSGSDGYSAYIFRNAVCPIVSENNWYNVAGSKEIYNEQKQIAAEEGEDYNPVIVPCEKLEERVKELQYVVIFHADTGFIDSYAELFGRAENIYDGSVYKVNNNQGQTLCELVGTTGIMGWR